jgi:hypothetical protein
MAVGQKGNYSLLPLLTSAGLLSGLITAALVYPAGKIGWYVLGGVFGAIMALALAMCELLSGLWKAIVLPVATAASYYLSMYAAGFVELGINSGNFTMGQSPTVSPVSLFAGGVVGGFFVLSVISILIHPKVGLRTIAVKSIAWSLVGGVLGIIGWALGPTLGMAIWSGVRDVGLTAPTETFQNALGEPSHRDSLFVVWQTGMALVLAVLLRRYEAKSPVTRHTSIFP